MNHKAHYNPYRKAHRNPYRKAHRNPYRKVDPYINIKQKTIYILLLLLPRASAAGWMPLPRRRRRKPLDLRRPPSVMKQTSVRCRGMSANG